MLTNSLEEKEKGKENCQSISTTITTSGQNSETYNSTTAVDLERSVKFLKITLLDNTACLCSFSLVHYHSHSHSFSLYLDDGGYGTEIATESIERAGKRVDKVLFCSQFAFILHKTRIIKYIQRTSNWKRGWEDEKEKEKER